jgi:hypothetical protein
VARFIARRFSNSACATWLFVSQPIDADPRAGASTSTSWHRFLAGG